MAFDSATTAAVVSDLQERLAGSRIDKIVGPSDDAVGLLFWTGAHNQWVLFSAHAQRARVAPTARRLAGAGSEPSPFVMLLRKYLEGQRVSSVEQVGRDRIVRLHAPATGVTLIAELMGKHSNVILVDSGGMILGSVKRVTAQVSRYREVLPHRPYLPPPPQLRRNPRDPAAGGLPKLDPLTCLAGDLAAALGGQPADQPLAQALVECLDGCSPQLAREVVARLGPRSGGATMAGAAATLETGRLLLETVGALYAPEPGLPRPTMAWQAQKLLGWAVYPLHQHDGEPGVEVQPCATLEELLDSAYESGDAETSDPMDAARRPLLQALDAHRERARRKISSLHSALLAPVVVASLREKGQLLLAYGHTLGPDDTVLRVEEPPVEIPVDPALTPVENAQAYFHRYAKARDAAAKIPALVAEAEGDLAFLDQARVFVELARSPADLTQVRTDLRDAGVAGDIAAPPQKVPKKHRGGKAAPPPKGKGSGAAGSTITRVEGLDGMEILVGRSAAQNELVTFSLARGDDIWLHARQIPGAHVIIKAGGRPPSPRTLQQAAELAATYSQARGATAVPVDYTFVRHVRRIKGGKPGLVHYSGETTLNVRPRHDPQP